MRRRDVLRAAAGAAALPLASTAAADQQASYEPLGHAGVEKAKEAVVGADGDTAYVAATDGFATVDVSDPANPSVLANVSGILADRDTGPLSHIYDVKVDGDTLIVVGPANATQEETLQGMAVYDVSDPANPERTGFHATDYPIHNSYLDGDVAYLTANNRAKNPVVLVDVSGGTPTEIARWSAVEYDSAWSDVHWYLRTTHDVYVHDGVLYVAHWDAGTWLVDVSDPTNPSHINHFGHYSLEELIQITQPYREGIQLPGNSHYVAVNDDATLLGSGAEAWDQTPNNGVDNGPGGIDLWDITDPENPEKVSYIAPPPTPDPSYGGLWTTSHNFDFHGDRLYTSWYRGGVKIHDVSDPANPEELTWWRQPEQAKFWTAQYATGDAFVASNMDDGSDDHPAGVYTFPNRAGEQATPPELVENTTTTTTTATTTQTTEKTTTTTTTTTTSTATSTATTATAGGPDATTTNGGGSGGESGGGSPGFGVLAGLSAVSAGALAAWRRHRE